VYFVFDTVTRATFWLSHYVHDDVLSPSGSSLMVHTVDLTVANMGTTVRHKSRVYGTFYLLTWCLSELHRRNYSLR